MNCVASTVKYLLYIFNIIFVICGILLIVLGSIMVGNLNDIASFDNAINTNTIPILIIVLGCIVFVVSFFGCCGAIKENSCCTNIYAIFMFILCVLQVTLAIWVLVNRTKFLESMESIVDKAWDENNTANGYPMNVLQVNFKCCGKTNYLDYMGQTVPPSCCGFTSSTETCSADEYIKKPGCRQEFADFWSTNFDIIAYAGFGVALVELVVFIVAYCLASSMRRSRG